MTIDISHTASDGTLVDGTARGDGTNAILKAAGFRWFRTLGMWGIPNSRDRQPNHVKIQRAADALRQAGHDVEIHIDNTHRPAAEAEADLAQRRADRAAALDAKADRRADQAAAADTAYRRAHEALPEGGEPIHVGHHSERRHRNAIERARQATRKAIDAHTAAEAAARKADVAATSTDRRYNPVTVKNRLDKLEAEQRSDQRQLDGYRRVVARSATTEYVDEFPGATGEHRERIIARMAQRADEIAYWSGIYTELQQAGLANTYGRGTITKGDFVKYRSSWYEVMRANAKTVSVRLFPEASFTNTVAYHELCGHRPAEQT